MLLERNLIAPLPPAEPPAASTPSRARWIVLALGGVLYLLAVHGQWDVPIAAWLAGVFLLRFTRASRPWAGFAVVAGVTAVGVAYYLFQAGMQVFGPMLLLCVPLGLGFVLPYLIDRLISPRLRRPLPRSLVFPLAIVAAEYVIATATPIGSALSSLAVTQHENLPLLQLTAITGSYGVSFLVAWFASVVNQLWEHGLFDGGAGRPTKIVALTFAGVLALVIIGGTARLAFFAPSAETARVAGVTWSKSINDRADSELDRYESMLEAAQTDPAVVRRSFAMINNDLLASTEREARAGAELVVWPEAGAAVLEADRAAFLEQVGALAARTGSYVEVGLGVITEAPPHSRNEAILIDPTGAVLWTYQKAHPVPFLDSTIPGDGVVPKIATPLGRIANVICFDADFPTLMRQPDVDLMLVPSNDWLGFGQTHTEKITLRAIENGYSVVRQDSNGLSRIIDPQGRTLAQSDFFTTEQQTVVADVPITGSRTIYGAIGDVFAWLCLAALAVLVAGGVIGRRRGVAG
ncbi:apolipoprotein N-acyltransferase [Microlunatus speluncae]|uniref:apolipoprotein N-acyltransferase n=1 Tax=Microlunatus speluncae TaxID=2594267 RepID=UPI0012666330|nr:nitrilase-related carbon-nitrogen hydrolase [Microlunatus speluncae]